MLLGFPRSKLARTNEKALLTGRLIVHYQPSVLMIMPSVEYVMHASAHMHAHNMLGEGSCQIDNDVEKKFIIFAPISCIRR
jgi:hypothetical protein